jgi:phage-related protein
MILHNKRFLLIKISFSLFLILSSTIIIPQVTSQPTKSYMTRISELKKKVDTFLPFKENSNLAELNPHIQGLFEWIIKLLTFLLNIVQKLITFISKAIQLVSLLEHVFDAIQVLIDLISQLIDAIGDLFSPDLELVPVN